MQRSNSHEATAERRLIAAINRKLAESNQRLRRSRSMRMFTTLGEFYVYDGDANFICMHHVDIEALGCALGVIRAGVGVAVDECD